MNYFRKIISCFVLFAIISSCVIVESKAADYTSMSNFWTWSSQYTWGLVDQLLGMVSDSVCTESEDEKHHASSYQYDAGDGYYRCVCQHCGETFQAYESDISSAYDSYVDDLQTDLGTTTLIDGGVRVYFPCTSYEKGNLTIEDISLGTCSRVYAVNSSSSASSVSFLYDTISVPFACNFTTGMAYASNIVPHTFDSPPYYFHSGTASSGGKIFLLFETTCRIIFTVPADSYVDAVLYAYADCIPIQSIDSLTSQDITINSRPTSIVGDYGIMGDDGSIVKVEGGSLVNESEKLVYSPTTAGEITYTDCVFDYADRSYTLTLEDGSTMKVVYGDENVTIHEGDTIYNVYYLSSDSGSGGSGSDGGGSGDGSVGDAVSGFLGALGDVISGLISGLLSLATKALEALVGLGDLLRQMGEALIGFFGGFTDFLGAVFPFLPEETFTILNLGLILMIAAAVFKKFF